MIFFDKSLTIKVFLALIVMSVSFTHAYYDPLVSITYTSNDMHVTTPYGSFISKEPIIRDLVTSQAMQRLTGIHQYGPSHYIKAKTLYANGVNYTRFDHSICLWTLYRLKGRPLVEQVSALLHDISHTAFSHVADFLYQGNKKTGCAYQDDILKQFLIDHGIATILKKYNFSLDDICQKPYLDRIDYTFVGGLLAGKITQQELAAVVADLDFHEADVKLQKQFWYFTTVKSAQRLVALYLETIKLNMSAPWNTVVYEYTKHALEKAFQVGIIKENDFAYALSDDNVWALLTHSNDPIIKQCMDIVINHDAYIENAAKNNPIQRINKQTCSIVSPKFRELDPYVKVGDDYVSLLEIDYETRQHYNKIKCKIETGWLIDLANFTLPIRCHVLNGH
jgi:uncharacterized protein